MRLFTALRLLNTLLCRRRPGEAVTETGYVDRLRVSVGTTLLPGWGGWAAGGHYFYEAFLNILYRRLNCSMTGARRVRVLAMTSCNVDCTQARERSTAIRPRLSSRYWSMIVQRLPKRRRVLRANMINVIFGYTVRVSRGREILPAENSPLTISHAIFSFPRKHTLNCHRMKPALFSVLCEIKEKTGEYASHSFNPLAFEEAAAAAAAPGAHVTVRHKLYFNIYRCVPRPRVP